MTTLRLNQVQTIDPATLKRQLEQQRVTLIDVREPVEFAGEFIPGAQLIPLSKFDPRAIPPLEETTLVLYCRSGSRSMQAAQKLLAAGFSQVTHLEGGIEAWKQSGYGTQVNRKAPLSLMRQVQIVTGSLVLTGTLLGVLVSPWFLLLSGFVGCGLLFAGITDTCMLAMVLAKLPYNQRSRR